MAKNQMISLADPVLGEDEKHALCAVIDSGWITMGDRVSQLEERFARLHGVEKAVAVNSCTAGLHLCLAGLGIGPGDEVLVPSMTFVATANAVLYADARPVFVDILSGSLPHISLEDAKAKLSSKTRAVIVMHYGGYLVDIQAWRKFTDSKGIFLIEDAAHSPIVEGTGQHSDAAAFSFFTNKNMTTAEGGMVFAKDSEVLERVRRMRSHGMTSLTLERHRGHAFSYDVTSLGYNYRLDELRASIGLVQLPKVPEWNSRRRELTNLYRELIDEKLSEVAIPFGPDNKTAAHLMPVLLPGRVKREKVMTYMRESGIQTSIHYPPIHLFTYYREHFPWVSLLNTEAFFERELSLPLHPGLRDADVERVVMTLKEALRGQ